MHLKFTQIYITIIPEYIKIHPQHYFGAHNHYFLYFLTLFYLIFPEIKAQDSTQIKKNILHDTIKHHYKITQVYCKLKTVHGHLQNEKFFIYRKEKLVYEFSITDYITEYYFPLDLENWHVDDELFLGIENITGHFYHFKRRKRDDGIYEYDLIIDIEKIKKRHH